MLSAIILAGIFYIGGAFVSGKILKNRLAIWKALLSVFVVFLVWLWLLDFAYYGDIPQAATSQVGFGSTMLFFGLRSEMLRKLEAEES